MLQMTPKIFYLNSIQWIRSSFLCCQRLEVEGKNRVDVYIQKGPLLLLLVLRRRMDILSLPLAAIYYINHLFRTQIRVLNKCIAAAGEELLRGYTYSWHTFLMFLPQSWVATHYTHNALACHFWQISDSKRHSLSTECEQQSMLHMFGVNNTLITC